MQRILERTQKVLLNLFFCSHSINNETDIFSASRKTPNSSHWPNKNEDSCSLVTFFWVLSCSMIIFGNLFFYDDFRYGCMYQWKMRFNFFENFSERLQRIFDTSALCKPIINWEKNSARRHVCFLVNSAMIQVRHVFSDVLYYNSHDKQHWENSPLIIFLLRKTYCILQ